MDVSYFLTLSNSRVTNELPTSYRQEYYYSYYIITSYHELPLKIKFKNLISIFLYFDGNSW